MTDVLGKYFWEAVYAGEQAFLVQAPQREHERVVQRIAHQAKEKKFSVMVWSPGDGLSSYEEREDGSIEISLLSKDAITLALALEILADKERSEQLLSEPQVVVIIKWPAFDCAQNAAARARLCNMIASEMFISRRLDRVWPAVLLMHSSESLPKPVLDHLVEIPWELPDEAHFLTETIPQGEQALRKSLEEARKRAREAGIPLPISAERQELIQAGCPPELRQKVARELRGLDAMNARSVLSIATMRCGSFLGQSADGDVLSVIQGLKDGVLRSSASLEPVPEHEIPQLDELVGMPDLIQWMTNRALAYTPKARKYHVAPPRFIIIAGVTGAGKSMAFRALSRITGKKPYVLNLTRCMDRWIGSSENNVREAFASAYALQESFCLEEIDKMMAGTQGSGETDGGVRRSILGETLRFIDKLIGAPDNETLLIATCNRLQDLAPELLRRADKIWGVDMPDDEERWQILMVHCQRLKIDTRPYLETFIDNKPAKVAILATMKDFVGYDVVKGLADAHAMSLNNKEPHEPGYSEIYRCGQPIVEQLTEAFKARKPVIAQDPEGVQAQIELVRSKCDPVNSRKKKPAATASKGGRERRVDVSKNRDE